jgi:hypothetical protein
MKTYSAEVKDSNGTLIFTRVKAFGKREALTLFKEMDPDVKIYNVSELDNLGRPVPPSKRVFDLVLINAFGGTTTESFDTYEEARAKHDTVVIEKNEAKARKSEKEVFVERHIKERRTK